MINCNSTSHGNFQDKANYKQITCEDTVPESGRLSSDLFFCIRNPHGQPLVFGDSTPLCWVLPSSRGAKEEGMGLAGVVWVKPWGGSAHGSPFVPLVPNPAQGHLCPICPRKLLLPALCKTVSGGENLSHLDLRQEGFCLIRLVLPVWICQEHRLTHTACVDVFWISSIPTLSGVLVVKGVLISDPWASPPDDSN